LDSVVTAFSNGASAEEIVQQFPTLRLSGVYGVIAYYLVTKKKLNGISSLGENKLRGSAQITRPSLQEGIRDRLIARRGKDT
jgi:hypothetical protein